ncbi:lipid-A-disaccharide synthase [secondary endosymbiont of Heteropsylla cubana]|uniref:lipid-A-disaccharide synthase n=1 Tax=secondary endosymbiont of Heteropsylla cubana TaxID=134287 RepID=UPI0005C74A80|nr:lipid-A-disaccharide synthase [secondary endosymbiont of Heteropsylla cubana]
MSSSLITIGLVAGEASGDILGAGLIRAIRRHVPKARFIGIAGPLMKLEGMESWYSMEELTVMGLMETLERIPRILRIRHDLIARFSILRPDVFVGIDSPDFTIYIEKKLKQRGIRTIHYVSPSIWAWRKKRIFKIRQATDNVLAVLPFEKALYDSYNVPCQFIGHTLADVMPIEPDKKSARKFLNIRSDALCLVLLPGSRKSEIEMLSADFLRAAEQLYKRLPKLDIIVSLVSLERQVQFEKIKSKVAPKLPLRLLKNQSREAMTAANVTLLASGTASLECMLAKCPMVVAYRMNPLTFSLARRLIKTSWISLPNLLAGRALVNELLQEACHPESLVNALLPFLHENRHDSALLATFSQLHQRIRCNADEQAARAVLKLISNHQFFYKTNA